MEHKTELKNLDFIKGFDKSGVAFIISFEDLKNCLKEEKPIVVEEEKPKVVRAAKKK